MYRKKQAYPFWTACTPDGEFRLERAFFPRQGDLGVPLRQVAQALGLMVEVACRAVTADPLPTR